MLNYLHYNIKQCSNESIHFFKFFEAIYFLFILQLLMNNGSSPSLSSGASLASGPASHPTSPAMPTGVTPVSCIPSMVNAGYPPHSAATLSGLSPACAAYSGSMLAGTYSRLTADSMYSNPYAAAVQGSYLPLTTDPSAFYSPLVSLLIQIFIFYFIAKSYTYQKYGIQHRYTIII